MNNLVSEKDEEFMKVAIGIANDARKNGNEPFGAVLVKDGKILMSGENKIYSQTDPTHHAEIGVIRDYCIANDISDLSEYTLYSSCEPCCMCSGAMVWSKLGKLAYSISHDQLAKIAGSNIMIGTEEVFEKSPNAPIVIANLLMEEGLKVFDGYSFG